MKLSHTPRGLARPSKEAFLVAVLLGIGAGAYVIAWHQHRERSRGLVPRPEATGEVGFLAAYAQTPAGPVQLRHGERRDLARPQDIAFQWTARGTGPRLVRIQLEAEGRSDTVFERRMQPSVAENLEYVLKLGEDVPSEITIVATIEAPHDRAVVLEYPLRLVAAKAPPGSP